MRVFQEFATLDLLSRGRAEIVAGRGSFTDSFPLFGLRLEDYDSLFAEHLDLLIEIRDNEFVHWSGKHRAPLTGQGLYPTPVQSPLPMVVWLGVAGSPQSFARAGTLGLALMVAIIGGETRRFHPFVDLYREAADRAGHLRLLVADPDEVVDEIVRQSDALGGVSRFTFQMNAASLPHAKIMQAIELVGARIAPALREVFASD